MLRSHWLRKQFLAGTVTCTKTYREIAMVSKLSYHSSSLDKHTCFLLLLKSDFRSCINKCVYPYSSFLHYRCFEQKYLLSVPDDNPRYTVAAVIMSIFYSSILFESSHMETLKFAKPTYLSTSHYMCMIMVRL